jgi:hypothetical protein
VRSDEEFHRKLIRFVLYAVMERPEGGVEESCLGFAHGLYIERCDGARRKDARCIETCLQFLERILGDIKLESSKRRL